jgi:hypothetical protein
MRGRNQGGNKNEKIDELSDIKFRTALSLTGNPGIHKDKNPVKIRKEKIYRQYMKCSKKTFELISTDNTNGRLMN